MAQIVINEISDNYTYNVGTSSFATVALPITATWGPAYRDPASDNAGATDRTDAMLEATRWTKFPASREGLENFVATYRGPSSNYKLAGDYSYQMAMTLLSAGYDVLVCRVCPGAIAGNEFTFTAGKALNVKAKYPGAFGNNLKLTIAKLVTKQNGADVPYWNVIVYVVDSLTGAATAAENLVFTFGYNDMIPNIDEVKSKYVIFKKQGDLADTDAAPATAAITLIGGTDVLPSNVESPDDTNYYSPVLIKPADWATSATTYYKKSGTSFIAAAATDWEGAQPSTTIYAKSTTSSAAALASYKQQGTYLATSRYTSSDLTAEKYYKGAGIFGCTSGDYVSAWNTALSDGTAIDAVKFGVLAHMEWCYNAAFLVYQLLTDKLNYNPNRIMCAWDDQNTVAISGAMMTTTTGLRISPMHYIIANTAYYSRCATGMLDIPRAITRDIVYNDDVSSPGYAQMVSAMTGITGAYDVNSQLFITHSALFGPAASYKLIGMQKMVVVSPSFLALLIHRAQLMNQSARYEWLLPSNRRHNLRIGEPEYNVPKKLLDKWQKLDGVGVNVIASIPDLGINVWGNSTLYDVPPATYQALANLSTRWLVNAVEDIAYKCGLAITFQYNNNEAYSAFYAGVVPTLDTMRSQGAIEDYAIKMSADIDGLDQVNANSVIGTIYLVINGVINDITIDLIALPPGTDLTPYKS